MILLFVLSAYQMFAHIKHCKFVDRRTGERKSCGCAVARKKHRRGYASVSCTVGHTWVWCKHCCDCLNDTDQQGCLNPQHWFERDSYDTGSRNHIQRHSSVLQAVEQSKKRRIEDLPKKDIEESCSKKCQNLDHEMFVNITPCRPFLPPVNQFFQVQTIC